MMKDIPANTKSHTSQWTVVANMKSVGHVFPGKEAEHEAGK